jgi:hypothetical protein
MTRLAPQLQGSVAPAGKEPSTETIPAAADAVRRFRTKDIDEAPLEKISANWA